MSDDNKTNEVEALSAAVLTIDGARRVGWAKAFDAERRIDDLEEQVRQLQDERKYLRRAYSRLVGLVKFAGVVQSPAWSDEFAAHARAEFQMRQEDAYAEGIAVGKRHLDFVNERTEAEIEVRNLRARAFEMLKRELFDEGAANGHLVEGYPASDQSDAFAVCSCGETKTDPEPGRVNAWKKWHLANVLHGVSWFKWSKPRVDALVASWTLDT